MARCAACNTYILFGGVKDGSLRFCNEACHVQGKHSRIAASLPDYAVDDFILDIHQGACPDCMGPGPVDVHQSHFVWSAVVLTSWKTRERLQCRSCARKRQALDMAGCMVLGWWGFPGGLIVTPIQIIRNICSMCRGPSPDLPSPRMEQILKLEMARQFHNRGGDEALTAFAKDDDAT